TGLVSVTVVVRTRSPVENAVPWTKVGVVAWPTAGRARRAARAAITARRAPDGAEGKSFIVIYSLTTREWRERELAWDSTRLHGEREVALRVASNRRAGDPSPFSRAVFEAPERNVGIGKDESELVRALERAQLAEERGHLARRVFVDPVQAHERIDQEGPRAVAVEGGTQAGAIARGIETEGRRDDEAEVEIAGAEAAGGGARREARARVGGGVVGAVEEDGAGLRHGEATERRGAGRDRDRDVEGEPGLPDLGGAADHADAVGTPEARTAVIREQCVTAVSEGDGDARRRPG